MKLTKKGQETQERILAAARNVLVKEGLDHLVMRDIATICGMKLGNLQYYFKSREDLLLAVIQRESQRDLDAIGAIVDLGEAPETNLRKLIGCLLTRWIKEDGAAIYATLSVMQLHQAGFRALYNEIYSNHYASIENLILQNQPALKPAERQIRVQLLTALIDGALLQLAAGSDPKFLQRVQEQAIAIALA